MRSFISNFNNNSLFYSILLSTLLSIFILIILETYLRENGHRTTIIDDRNLWSHEMGKINGSRYELALIGSSRMLADISISVLSNEFPNYTISNLALDGNCPEDLLHYLANDTNFSGILLVDTFAECVFFDSNNESLINKYIDYYVYNYNLNAMINRKISNFIQNALVFVDPYVNLLKLVGSSIINRKTRQPRYWETKIDRSQYLDYSAVDIEDYSNKRINFIKRQYPMIISKNDLKRSELRLKKLHDSINMIADRGGEVIFLRLPVSGTHWYFDERYFPKAKFWDRIGEGASVNKLHFIDWLDTDEFECPDTSHLDMKDKDRFTRLLVEELHKRDLINNGNR